MLIEELNKRKVILEITIDEINRITALNCNFGFDENKLYRWISFKHTKGDIEFGYNIELSNRMDLLIENEYEFKKFNYESKRKYLLENVFDVISEISDELTEAEKDDILSEENLLCPWVKYPEDHENGKSLEIWLNEIPEEDEFGDKYYEYYASLKGYFNEQYSNYLPGFEIQNYFQENMNDDEYKLLGMIYNEGPPYNPPFDYITINCNLVEFNSAIKSHGLPFLAINKEPSINTHF